MNPMAHRDPHGTSDVHKRDGFRRIVKDFKSFQVDTVKKLPRKFIIPEERRKEISDRMRGHIGGELTDESSAM